MQTVCKNCGTTQGPFVRDRDIPNSPSCGIPERKWKDYPDTKTRYAAERKITQECLARRDMRFAGDQ